MYHEEDENVFLVLICILQNDDHDDMYDDTHKHKRCTYQRPGGTVLKLVEISTLAAEMFGIGLVGLIDAKDIQPLRLLTNLKNESFPNKTIYSSFRSE